MQKKEAHNKIQKDDVLKDIKHVYDNRGENKFKLSYYLEHGKYSKAPIKRLGGWNALMKELGIEINMHKKISKEDIIKDFLRVKEEYGSVKSTVYRKYGNYSQKPIDDLFGTFGALVEAAGCIPERVAKHLSDEEVLSIIKNLYDKHGFLTSVLIDKEAPFTYVTVFNRFGGMNKVYERLKLDGVDFGRAMFKASDRVIDIIAEHLCEKPIKEWTCKELMNPELTNHLYVDAYFPEHNIIIEYDGQQHFEYVEYIHKTYEKFERNQLLDKHKEQIINTLGIKLIRFKYNESKKKDYIIAKIQQSM